MHFPGRNPHCQRFQVSCGRLWRPRRRRSRHCSSSKNAHAKQAPRQPERSSSRNAWSTSVRLLMHVALQQACRRADAIHVQGGDNALGLVFFRRIVKFLRQCGVGDRTGSGGKGTKNRHRTRRHDSSEIVDRRRLCIGAPRPYSRLATDGGNCA
jgi:hypothetical protein